MIAFIQELFKEKESIAEIPSRERNVLRLATQITEVYRLEMRISSI